MRLFIGNLPFAATEEDIQAMFQKAGITADTIQVMRDKFSGKSRGFGFADIHDPAAAQRAVTACHGRDLMGRALIINEARPSQSAGGPGDRDRSASRRDRGPRA